MGVENYLVTAAVKGVLAQRLVRRNCPHCLMSYRPPETVLRRAGLLELADAIDFRRSGGCNQCRNTGFAKLTGIFEFMEITNSITELILRGASLNEIRKDAARTGYIPLFEAGLEKLMAGEICLEELLKETSNIEDYFGYGRSQNREERNAVTV